LAPGFAFWKKVPIPVTAFAAFSARPFPRFATFFVIFATRLLRRRVAACFTAPLTIVAAEFVAVYEMSVRAQRAVILMIN